MDMFLNSQEISLQEMLDRDMKTEIDDVFGHSDLSLSLSELPPLDLDESFGADMPMWFTSSGTLAVGNASNSNSNFNLDFGDADGGAAKMVDPTSVIPCLNGGQQNGGGGVGGYLGSSSSSLSPDIKDEPYSPQADEDVNVDSDHYEVPAFGMEDADDNAAESVSPPPAAHVQLQLQQHHQQPQQQQQQQQQPQHAIATAVQTGRNTLRITTTASSATTETTASGAPTSFANSFRNGVFKSLPIVNGKLPIVHQINGCGGGGDTKNGHTVQTYQIRDVRTLNIQSANVQAHTKKLTKQYVELEFDEKAYPKPAYSYSCLIAMALKNSATGSLPVSEIYNFMCEHFPYFKTAPNGWKNSVRHNLSLNKCFEKIEKPAGNGSQRKGCLWAMNPNKIAKMDEEVQKWSKKDPMAIKKAMINPENLEMLERGDLKRDFPTQTSTGSSGGSLSDASSDDEGVMSPQTPQSQGREYVNTYALDSDDSSSEDLDVDVGDGILYEELDADDEKLNLGVTLTSAVPESLLTINSSPRLVQAQQTVLMNKRPKVTTAGIHGNYVYQPVMSGWGSGPLKRKTPLLLRTSNSTLGSSLIKVDDSV